MIITDLVNSSKPAKLFKNKLKSEGRSYTWVANSLGYSVAHIFNILNEKDTLTENLRAKLNKLLETNY